MTYSPFEPRVLPIFIYYIFLTIFGALISVKMFYKWRERKVSPPLYLTLAFSFLTIALLGISIGLAEAAITGYYKEIYRFSLPFGYSMVVVSNVFLYIFSSNITQRGKKVYSIIIIISVLLIIMLFLPWNWWGVPSIDYAGQFSLRIYSTSSLVLFSYIIYGYIAYISFKLSRRAEKKTTRLGLTLLFYAMISLMLLFLMLVLDTLMILLFNHPGYSEFTYIAWIFGVIFIILSYLSLVMPEWLVKRIEKN
ncbi:MAG: hypothetical protein ACFFDX_14160 [Candidatus Odinarchaeota archaeon]